MNNSIVVVCAALSLTACGTKEAVPDATNRGPSRIPMTAPNSTAAPDGRTPGGDASSTPAVWSHAAWVGRWRGVEGLNLVISEGSAPGVYELEMQYGLEAKGVFRGTDTDEGIAFQRPGGTQVLRPTNGDDTGLKWLAGKKTCLTVKEGEGYCRD